ncbi:MAG: Mur ligase domain-containing protein, partial [Patescibacteria group bacterium]
MKPKKKYHFTGVAGTGMSALAAILKQRGREITGS